MRSFPEHFLCSANVLFLCQTNVYVNEVASFTDENEFGMDLSNFKKVGKNWAPLPWGRVYSHLQWGCWGWRNVSILSHCWQGKGSELDPGCHCSYPLPPWPRVRLRAFWFPIKFLTMGQSVWNLSCPGWSWGSGWPQCWYHVLAPPLNNGVTLNKSLNFSRSQFLSWSKWGFKENKKTTKKNTKKTKTKKRLYLPHRVLLKTKWCNYYESAL